MESFRLNTRSRILVSDRILVDRVSAICRSGFGEQEHQLIVIDRLDQVMIKPSLLCPPSIFLLAIAGNGNDDRVSTVQVLPQFRSHFVTVQARQADVQEDVVRPLPARKGKGGRAVVRGSDIVPKHFEQLGQGPCRVTVVIDNKDMGGVIGCPGDNVTVLAPGWLGNFGGGEADSELRSRVSNADDEFGWLVLGVVVW